MMSSLGVKLRGAIIGHLVIDYVVRHGKVKRSLGGSAAYCSFALKRYGIDVSIISKVGPDFPEEYLIFLSRNGIDISNVKLCKRRSTSFKLVYLNDKRTLFLLNICEPILEVDLPSDVSEYDFIHIGSVVGEVPLCTIKELKKKFNGLIALDIQGYIRSFEKGKVINSPTNETFEVLKYVDILHADLNEAMALCSEKDLNKLINRILDFKIKISLITMGSEGSLVISKEGIYEVPIAKPKRVVDLTGAGDVYTAIFIAHYMLTNNIKEAAIMASSAASYLIEDWGLSGMATYDKIVKRAYLIKNLVKEL